MFFFLILNFSILTVNGSLHSIFRQWLCSHHASYAVSFSVRANLNVIIAETQGP